MAAHTSAELRSHLSRFVDKQKIPTEGATFYSHVLPSPQERTLSERTVLGKNWALIGDAAAWVDPLTGEGLFYAMKSGRLLGKALAEGCPEKYPAWVKAEFSAELEFAARIVRRFYRGSFLGTAVTTRMDIAQSLTQRIHFNTFGGNPMSTAAALGVLDVIDEENRLVISSAWDRVTVAHVDTHQSKLSVDPHFNPDFKQLVEATAVTALDIDGRG